MALSLDNRWIPNDASTANLTFTNINCGYTELNGLMFVFGRFNYPTTADTNGATIGGLPVPVVNQLFGQNPNYFLATGGASPMAVIPLAGTSKMLVVNAANGNTITNATLSGATVVFNVVYPGGLA